MMMMIAGYGLVEQDDGSGLRASQLKFNSVEGIPEACGVRQSQTVSHWQANKAATLIMVRGYC